MSFAGPFPLIILSACVLQFIKLLEYLVMLRFISVNAADNKQRDKNMTMIKIVIDP